MGEGAFSFNVKLKDSLCLPVFAAQAGSPGLGPHPWESGHLRNELKFCLHCLLATCFGQVNLTCKDKNSTFCYREMT